MRKLLTVAGLLLLWSGCRARGAEEGLVPPGRLGPRVKLPGGVTEKTYPRHREIYDALPPGSAERRAYRQVLLAHLVPLAARLFKEEKENEGLEAFRSAVTLFDPTEVFRDSLEHRGLAGLAGQVMALFSPQGDENRVVLALAVRMTLGRRPEPLLQEYRRIARWLEESQVLVRGEVARYARLIEVLEETAEDWPSPFVVQELSRLYLEQISALSRLDMRHAPTRRNLPFTRVLETGYRMALLYLRVDQPDEALEQIEQLPVLLRQDELRRELLRKLVSPKATVGDYARLVGEVIRDQHFGVGLTLCRSAQRRFPRDAAAHSCVGRLAAQLGRTLLAEIHLEEAVRLQPGSWSYVTDLARQYHERLSRMVEDGRVKEATRQLGYIESFYRRIEKRFKKPLEPSLAEMYFIMGYGYFLKGQVEQSASAYRRAIISGSHPRAFHELCTIRLNQGRTQEVLADLDQAVRGSILRSQHGGMRLLWLAQIEELRGRALEIVGRTALSREALRRALRVWQQLLALDLAPERKAEVHIHEAQNLFALGEKARALDAMERAIDANPEGESVYADVIAMLTTHGHLPEALDAFHRALGRAGISEYYKSYSSFWIIGLARRAGLPPDPLAISHLHGLSGDHWYDRLSRLLLGKVSFQTLRQEANGPGELAELYYYWGELLVARGKLKEARNMWRKVIETNMMGFYEYRMAAHNLRNGPAKVQTRPLDRKEEVLP